MDIWSLLGLEPTSDTSKIKKAYAQKLKIYHPEDDPEGFQTLKEAYDSAMKRAKYMKQKEERTIEKVDSEFDDSEADYFEYDIENEDNIEGNIEDLEILGFKTNFHDETNEEFMRKIEDLYNDFSKRIDIEEWVKLLNSSISWKITNMEYLNVEVLKFLTTHPNLPWEVLQLLKEHFSLDNPYVYERFRYDDPSIRYILRLLDASYGLSFKHLKNGEDYDIEEYLTLRQQAFVMLLEDIKNNALPYVQKAKEIYEGDPELLFLEGCCLKHIKEYAKALDYFNKVLTIMPDHEAALLSRGQLHYERKKYKAAIKDFTSIQDFENKFKETPLVLARCCYEIKDYVNARKWYLKVLEQKPTDSLKKRIIKIDEKILKRFFIKALFSKLKKEEEEERKQVKAELKKYEKQKLRSKTSTRLAFIFVWGVAAAFMIFSALTAKDIPSAKLSPPAASSSPGEIQLKLLNYTNPYIYDPLEASINIKVIKKLNLRQVNVDGKSPNSNTFQPIEDSTEKFLEPFGSVYLAQYKDYFLIIVLTKGEAESNSWPLKTTGTIEAFNKSDFSSSIDEALKKANASTLKVMIKHYVTVSVTQSMAKKLPEY